MRHQKAGRKLSRTSAHRDAMFSNMVTSLLLHERIETTEPKAKELKRIAEKAITWGVSVGELTAKSRDKLSADEKARIVHAKRMARRTIKQDEALDKLFSDVAPRFKGRPGGYTRLLKTRVRAGDAAPMAFVELVVRATEAPAAEPPAAKGKGKAALAEAAGTEAAPAQANKPRKTSAKKAESKEE